VQVSLEVVQLRPPGDEVTVYPVIADPPVSAGAVHETVTDVSPNSPMTVVAAPGGPAGTTELDATDAEPVPTRFVAVTVNV